MNIDANILRTALAAAALALPAGSAAADALSDFYKGKTMTIIVGADTGGGYDAQGRLMARHIGKSIPGNPNVIVQNMPGAGSLQAANNLFNIAAKDGTVFGLVQRGVLTSHITNPAGVHFQITKFNWIGNLSQETAVSLAWHTTPFKTIQDVMQKEMTVGGTGPTIDTETTPRLLNALIGTKFKVIGGYKGTADVALAMERGEVDGMGDWSWSNIKTRRPEFLRDGKIRLLLQSSTEKLPDLPDVPLAMDFVKNDTDRKVMELFLAQKTVARPVMAPPGIPGDRVAALRKAFVDMTNDAEFKADADKSKLEIEPTTGEAVEKVIKLIAATPPDIGKRLAEAIEPKR
ncbi:MAG: Bug family tripartite tricarboxylate transporter substrate binding protein [Gemmatimonas sp.]